MTNRAAMDRFLDVADERRIVADLGATHLRIALADGSSIESLAVRRTADLARDALHGIAPAVVAALHDVWREAAGRRARPAGVGVGVAAYVARDGTVLQQRPFGIERGPALRDGLAAAFECPVAVDNDANMAALGEMRHGAGRGSDDFLLITLGTNIGLGIVADGRIVRGAHGAAGEAGNMIVPVDRGDDGTAPFADGGRFGRGVTDGPAGYAWLEDLVGGGALARSLEPDPTAGRRGVFVRAASGDPNALAVVDRAIEGWSMLIADLVALFDPDCIVLSGGLVDDLRPFIEPLRRRAAALSPLPPDIRFGELGAVAGLVGAAEAARMAAAAAPGRNEGEPDERLTGTRR